MCALTLAELCVLQLQTFCLFFSTSLLDTYMPCSLWADALQRHCMMDAGDELCHSVCELNLAVYSVYLVLFFPSVGGFFTWVQVCIILLMFMLLLCFGPEVDFISHPRYWRMTVETQSKHSAPSVSNFSIWGLPSDWMFPVSCKRLSVTGA